MSTHTESTWTCDRCGTQETTTPNEQPFVWGRLSIRIPPMAADDARGAKTYGDICRACRESFDQWWNA